MLEPEIAKAVVDLRNDPIALDEMLFSRRYSLVPHLREMFRAIERHQFTFIMAARSAGKSYGCARYLVGYALRFPGTIIIISGPSYRQSRIPWKVANEIIFNESWFEWTDFLSHEPTQGSEESRIRFHNKSEIIALPASGTKLHGKRASVVLLTEFFDYDETLYTMTVLPMAAKRLQKDRENKIVYESTAGFQFQHSYSVFKKVSDMVAKGNPKYALLSIPIQTLRKEGWEIEEEIVQEVRDRGEDTYKQQFENVWLSDLGSFYVLSILKRDELKRAPILFHGDEKKKYVISLDTARSSRGTGDDSALAVFEVGRPASLVYLWSKNNITAKELSDEVARVMRRLKNVVALVLDKRGGGEYVMDSLAEDHGLISIDADASQSGQRLIVEFPSTPAEINRAHQELRSAFEDGTVYLPRKLDRLEDDSPEFAKVYDEVDSALKQLADLKVMKLPSGWLKFEEPTGTEHGQKRKKDKAYAVLYAFWGVNRFLEQTQGPAVDLGEAAVRSGFGDVLISAEKTYDLLS